MASDIYEQTLMNMEKSHAALTRRVPPPKPIKRGLGYVFRYEEQSVHQALIQKLARIVSGLHAAQLLLENGFFQELGALQRMLDEFNEAVSFLALGIVKGDLTELHQTYLAAFFEEEFNNPFSSIQSTQKRPMISRQKIHAYVVRAGGGSNPSEDIEVRRTIEKAYSGFVHGASSHIMDMYQEAPPSFRLRGMLGTDLEQEHRDDLWNYFYRGIGSFSLSAKAFGDDYLCQSILEYMRDFAAAKGEDYTHPPKIKS